MNRGSDIVALPSALAGLEQLLAGAGPGRALVCVDYDGTLTPIVATPERAVLAAETRAALAAMARRYHVAIITGRDLADVQRLVGLDGLYHAGCHGLRVAGPGGDVLLERGAAYLPEVRAATRLLRRLTADMSGVRVEEKELSVALHFRAAPERERQLERMVQEVTAADCPRLAAHPGRKVFELRPRLDWHKGRAAQWLMERLSPGLTIFIGDDLTDEDAFAVEGVIGVAVRDRPRDTNASYALENTDEVRRFLETLVQLTANS